MGFASMMMGGSECYLAILLPAADGEKIARQAPKKRTG
jgi:hypothetical protein